jgi:hypothetical protein
LFSKLQRLVFLQLCDVKEDAYFCHEHAIEYLQKMKQTQRRHCKLLYTHGKEEITAIIKMVNQRLEDEDSDSSSNSSDEIAVRRVSEVKQQQQQLLQQQLQVRIFDESRSWHEKSLLDKFLSLIYWQIFIPKSLFY